MWHPWLGSLARERMTRGPCTVPHKGCWTSGTSEAQNQLAETLDFCRELCVAASCKDFLHKQIHRTFLGALLLPYRGLWYRLRSAGHKMPCFLFQTKCNVITEWKAPASQRLYTHWGCSSVGGVLVYHAQISGFDPCHQLQLGVVHLCRLERWEQNTLKIQGHTTT